MTLPTQLLPLSKTKAGVLRKLQQKKYRLAQQAFLVEGVKPITAFLEAGHGIQQLIGTEDFFKQLATLPSVDTPCYLATPDTLAYVGNFSTNSTGIAVVDLPVSARPKLDKGEKGLALADIRDPGNLGTILRTACWYGITKVLFSPTTVDCFHPKAVQASMGALAHVHCYYTDLATYFTATRRPIVGATLSGKPLHTFAMPPTGWLVIGNEARGIPANLQALLTEQVAIPSFGPMESLNAAVATAVLCDNWQRQHA